MSGFTQLIPVMRAAADQVDLSYQLVATAPNHIRSEWAAVEAAAAAAGSSDRPHIGHGHAVKTGLQINMLGVRPKKEDNELSHPLSG